MNFASVFTVITYVSVLSAAVGNMSCRRDHYSIFSCNHIPKDIPTGVLEFRLETEIFDKLSFNTSRFASDSWDGLKSLKITGKKPTNIVLSDNCFNGLQFLHELHIHVWNPELFENTFLGLLNVEILDLSECGKLNIRTLKVAFNGEVILPRLKKIVLSNWNKYKGSISLDDCVEMLLPRNISWIDISNSQLSFLSSISIKKLKSLKVLNASYTVISDWNDTDEAPSDLRHIEVLDLSHATLPFKALPVIPGRNVFRNIYFNFSMARLQHFRQMFAIETVNLSDIVPDFSSIWVYNLSVKIDVDPLIFTKNINLQQNNIKRLDTLLLCDNFYFQSFQFMDISNNGLEFLNSAFLFCARNIVHLDMSRNKLYKMVDENEIMFQNLISTLEYLKVIKISENGFQSIPSNFFNRSQSIEEIDLSYNKLKQVNFDLIHLGKLKVLDLKGNNIQVLNSDSIHHLNSIPKSRHVDESKTNVYLQENPISCSVCSSKLFLRWILTTDLIKSSYQESLKCVDENGEQNVINTNTLKIIEKICRRKVIVISSSISSAILLILVMIFALFIFKRYKRNLKKRKASIVIKKLRQGNGQFQFAVFLSYSSEDEAFVKANVQDQLNENLQMMTGVDRQLVATGDHDFRPGHYIHNELERNIEAASVIIVVVSYSFIESEYCCKEVKYAHTSGKPIMLMFKEHVEEQAMERIPDMKLLFRRNVRILWTVENGEPVLKTTWENVGRSVLDLIELQ